MTLSFYLRCLNERTKTVKILLQEVLFANDCDFVAHTGSDLHMMLNRFSKASKVFGLTLSLGKTEVLHQPARKTASSIVIDYKPLAKFERFKFLGRLMSCGGYLDKKIVFIIVKASQAIGRLR
ncbi:hypothetical protein ElyMa_006183300 [Elysia marginata]|uniref:Reverse transcriptase domain-containing protein n=1 Tax=Elysia marginata TaxID=1093978 RepID=A0AAV4H4L8_9GAST|nr:hypothetical protein ElyMa_006183300 [Elysia marginata]